MDPVSKKEIDRNNAVYQIQHNRNPFIDFPELAEMIFGSDTNQSFITHIPIQEPSNWKIYPNPTTSQLNIQLFDNQTDNVSIELYDMMGKLRITIQNARKDYIALDMSPLAPGIYLLKVANDQNIHTYKIVKQ